MKHLSIDIETFSSVDLLKSGLYKYVQSPDFQILLFAYSVDGGPVEIIDFTAGEKIPLDLEIALCSSDVIKHAYNASFEWYSLSKYLSIPSPIAWLPQWRCTMMHGLYCGYTAGLGVTGKALGLPQDKQKLTTGKALIKTFCTPCKPSRANGNRTRTLPHHEPDKWKLFKEYCIQDVVTEMEIEKRLSSFPVPDFVQKEWELDQIINTRGVALDSEMVEGALYCSDVTTEELTTEAIEITGLENPNSAKQLAEWIETQTGVAPENMQKATVSDMIKSSTGDVKRALEIRQELSKTSVKKYSTMQDVVCDDGRIRGLFQFYGANRTGRWAGRFVQPQNLPRNYLETLPSARKLVKAKNVTALKMLYGNVPDTLSQLIRTAFVPSEGNTFLVADFSAIEARVIAWLAGEEWRQEVFKTHGKIYEASASAMFGVPIDKIVRGNPEYELRAKGKVAELALGYQGSTGALVQMGALKMGLAEDELPDIVQRWRSANKRIVDLWYSIENAALECMRTAQPQGVKGIIFAREGDFQNGQDFLTVTLPSGRKLFYVKPFMGSNKWGKDSICYYGMDQTTKKWVTLETYGGKLVENIVQAIARDCLAVSMQRLEQAGYKIVMHIHDEVVLDAEHGGMDGACSIMGQPITWADGLLLNADGFVTEFYQKD